MLEFAEDLECDLPKFWDYIAEVIVHPVSSGRLPLAELKKAHEGVLQSGKIGKLVGKTLSKCTTLEVCVKAVFFSHALVNLFNPATLGPRIWPD